MKIFRVRKIFYIPLLTIFLSLYIITGLAPNGEIHYVYGVCPVFVFYTDNWLEENEGGKSKGLLVFIRKEFKEYDIVLRHELVHAKQSYRTYFFDWIFLALSDRHIAKREAEAYATEITCKTQIKPMAVFIKEEYYLNVDVETIEKYILLYTSIQIYDYISNKTVIN
jgi:hypothetical protein